MILANTFFKTERGGVVSAREEAGSGGTGPAGSKGGTCREERVYLLRELRDHDLWKHPRWEGRNLDGSFALFCVVFTPAKPTFQSSHFPQQRV